MLDLAKPFRPSSGRGRVASMATISALGLQGIVMFLASPALAAAPTIEEESVFQRRKHQRDPARESQPGGSRNDVRV